MQNTEIIPITRDEIRATAEKMRADGRLLVMIHAFLEKDGTAVVMYDYSFGETIKEYEVRGEKCLPTISDIYDQAAAWPEREISELMDIQFEGLDTSERLFLPDNLLEGQGQILVTSMEELKKKNGNLAP